MEVIVERLPKFDVLYNLPARTNTVVVIGGRGGAKTYEVSKFATFKATMERRRTVIMRDEKELIRESILNEILMRYDTANASGVLSRFYDRLETGIKDKRNGDMLVFTKGFRASTTQKRANLKSISGIKQVIIEEAEDIRQEDKYNTFADGIREEDALIIIILNTPDIDHWIVKRWFNLELVEDKDHPGGINPEKDGFWRLIPKVIPGVVMIQTSFEDNPYLPAHIIANYKAYGDPKSATYNKYYYMTAIMGFASSGRKGQIHRNVRPIKLQEYMDLPYIELYGQDFGTARPAGMVGFKVYKNTTWARQLNYLPLPTLAIGKMYCQLGFGPKDKIVGDSADKEACEKLDKGWSFKELDEEDARLYPGLMRGFYMVKAKKWDGSVRYTINLMDSLQLFVVEESFEMWEEVRKRIYNQDKTGQFTNEPAPGFDHLLDPWGYGLVEVFGSEYGKKGNLKGKTGYFR
jgi:phage terminase large subunit